MKNKPFLIGLTGGIACGKSAAAGILEGAGAYIIDADEVSRSVIARGTSGYEKIKDMYADFFDKSGNLDRRALREYVFKNDKLDELNSVMHTLIIKEIENRINASSEELIILSVPLLFETGMDSYTDVVVTVTADYAARINRLIKRDNINEELAAKMIAGQLGETEKIEKSDFVIYNNGAWEDLRREVIACYEKIKERYFRKKSTS